MSDETEKLSRIVDMLLSMTPDQQRRTMVYLNDRWPLPPARPSRAAGEPTSARVLRIVGDNAITHNAVWTGFVANTWDVTTSKEAVMQAIRRLKEDGKLVESSTGLLEKP